MKAIVAIYHALNDERWGIGANGTKPIVLQADRKFFRETTKNQTIIFGYKTFLDFPNQKPLPKRRNIVLTHKNLNIDDLFVINDVNQVLESYQDAFIIGGASVYRQLVPFCDEIYITHIYADINADTFFPNLYKDMSWNRQVIAEGTENNIKYKIEKLTRKKE